ncbi:MAG TPA: ATP-binding cassette domain-containing protein [Acidimicrobiia bacterium]
MPPDTSVSDPPTESAESSVAGESAVSAESAESAVSAESAAPAISARGLARTYGEVTAVDALDLTIHQGEIYGLLGPNGAGKSTTVKMLCTLLAPTGGHADVAGFDIVARPKDVRLRIGVALQDVALDPKQTGLELLRLQGQLYGLRRDEIEARLVDLRELVDIGDALDRRIETYSGGMRRRLDLAAALVHNPDVLFLDEPTTGLDPISRASVWQEVQRLNDELGMTILLTTQYLEEADELCDRVGIVDNGRLVAEGTPGELKRSIGTDVVFARIEGDAAAARAALDGVYGVVGVEGRDHELTISVEDGSSAIGPIAIALHDASVRVRDLTLRTPTLDDVFLELTGAHFDTDAVGTAATGEDRP